jgi:hypothetical protein
MRLRDLQLEFLWMKFELLGGVWKLATPIGRGLCKRDNSVKPIFRKFVQIDEY